MGVTNRRGPRHRVHSDQVILVVLLLLWRWVMHGLGTVDSVGRDQCMEHDMLRLTANGCYWRGRLPRSRIAGKVLSE
jgi:hypothetical protein